MQSSTTIPPTIILVLFIAQRCCGIPVQQTTSTSRTKVFPLFMEKLYYNFTKGRFQLTNIIHSNTALHVKRSNTSFEAIFEDLDFTKEEVIRRCQVRLNIHKMKQCAPSYALRLLDDASNQILDDYPLVMTNNGINSLHLTSSLSKLAATPSTRKRLRMKITSKNPTQSSCDNTVNGLSSEVYLISDTEEKSARRHKRDAEGQTEYSLDTEGHQRISKEYSRYGRDLSKNLRKNSRKRRNTTPINCSMTDIWVPLVNTSRIALPNGFKTGVCEGQYVVPGSNDTVRKTVIRKVHQTLQAKGLASNSSSCCRPSKLWQLPVLYLDSKTHTVLRFLDNMIVTQCACTKDIY